MFNYRLTVVGLSDGNVPFCKEVRPGSWEQGVAVVVSSKIYGVTSPEWGMVNSVKETSIPGP